MSLTVRPKRPGEMTEEDNAGEALYHSVLGELDSLSPEQQLSVVHNWVRYVLVHTAGGGKGEVSFGVLLDHCVSFAQTVADIPAVIYELQTGKRPEDHHCGKCMACIMNGIKPEETTVQ